MQQHPVPQHIADFKFKLFGNLTARQFFTLLVPLSLAALIFFSGLPGIIRFPIAFIIGGVGMIIAVVPFNGQPFDKWAVAFIKAIMSPTQRIWVKEKKVPDFLSIIVTKVQTENKIPEELTSQKKQRLSAYLKTLPSENASPLDIKEQIALGDIDYSVQPSYADLQTPTASAKNLSPIIWPTVPEPQPVKLQPAINLKPSTQPLGEKVIGGKGSPITKIDVSPLKTSSMKIKPVTKPKPAKAKIKPHAKPYVVHGLEKRIHKTTSPQEEHVQLVSEPSVNLASDTNYSLDNIIPIITPDNKVRLLHGIGRTRARKLHFAPPVNFDIAKLPIRGEKRFEITNELKKKISMADFTPEAHLPKANQPVMAPKMKKAVVNFKPKIVPKAAASSPQNQGQQIQIPQSSPQVDTQKFGVTDLKKQTATTKPLSSAEIVPLTKTPNVVSGLVSDSLGAPVSGAVLVIRDSHGIPVRALKTNKLGQFLSSTPLSKGDYTVETESDLAKFETVSIRLEDKIIQPVSIVSRG